MVTLPNAQALALDEMVTAHGFSAVLNALADIATGHAMHAEIAHQPTAQAWDTLGTRLDALAARATHLAVPPVMETAQPVR